MLSYSYVPSLNLPLSLCFSLSVPLFVFYLRASLSLFISGPHTHTHGKNFNLGFMVSRALADRWTLGAFMIGCSCIFLELKSECSFHSQGGLQLGIPALRSFPGLWILLPHVWIKPQMGHFQLNPKLYQPLRSFHGFLLTAWRDKLAQGVKYRSNKIN